MRYNSNQNSCLLYWNRSRQSTTTISNMAKPCTLLLYTLRCPTSRNLHITTDIWALNTTPNTINTQEGGTSLCLYHTVCAFLHKDCELGKSHSSNLTTTVNLKDGVKKRQQTCISIPEHLQNRSINSKYLIYGLNTWKHDLIPVVPKLWAPQGAMKTSQVITPYTMYRINYATLYNVLNCSLNWCSLNGEPRPKVQ